MFKSISRRDEVYKSTMYDLYVATLKFRSQHCTLYRSPRPRLESQLLKSTVLHVELLKLTKLLCLESTSA